MATNELKMPYVNLGKSGLKVSKVIVGCMQYGNPKWQPWVLEEDAALPLLKHAYDNGLTTWDTADVYSMGDSERIISKAIKQYSLPRDRLVLLTKCFFGVADDGTYPGIQITSKNEGAFTNRAGLSRKHILDAVDASVARLGTYIDVLQIHRLDQSTPKEEIMRALNDVVDSGKVRYIGASSMNAWEFQMLQNIAERRGWHQFISMQNYHNLLYREEEREMIPYCQATGVGLIPWSPVARGALTRPWAERGSKRAQTDQSLKTNTYERESVADRAITERVEEVAKKLGVSMAGVATAWSIKRGDCPIIGLGSKERIEEAVRNANIVLSDEDALYLEEPYVPKVKQGHT